MWYGVKFGFDGFKVFCNGDWGWWGYLCGNGVVFDVISCFDVVKMVWRCVGCYVVGMVIVCDWFDICRGIIVGVCV